MQPYQKLSVDRGVEHRTDRIKWQGAANAATLPYRAERAASMQGGCLYSPCSRRLPSTSPLPHCARASIRHQSRSTRPACLSGGSTITPPSQCGLRLHASSSRSCPARPHRSVSSHCGRVHVWPQPAQCAGLLADQLQGSVMLRYNKRVL